MTSPNEDYYGWTQETAEKLRQGRLSEVNMADLIEEIEDMGRSERRALESRLSVLLMHLLKWQYQPERRGRGWMATIKHQRFRVLKLIKENPSLKPQVPTLIKEIYPGAVLEGVRETDLDEATFPSTFEDTGWSWEQILEAEFYPD